MPIPEWRGFAFLTPLGTTEEGRVLVEPKFAESDDKEPDDTPDAAVEAKLPAVLAGTIAHPGDVDYYRIDVSTGQEVVFQEGGAQLGSEFRPLSRSSHLTAASSPPAIPTCATSRTSSTKRARIMSGWPTR